MRKRWSLGILVCAWVCMAGCVTKGYHTKKMTEWKQRLAKAEMEHQARVKQEQMAQQKLQKKLEKQMLIASKMRKNCQDNLANLANKNSAKARRLRRALAYINQLEATTQEWRNLYNRLITIFKVKIDSGALAVRMERGMIILRMPEKVLFELGSAKLRESGESAIQDVAKALKKYKYRWQVAGHADPTGKSWFNWDLSYRRAMRVLRVMLEQGMPPKQVSAAAFGQYQPTVSNETKEGRAQNRRTEIVFVPRLDKLLKLQPSTQLSEVCPAPRGKKKS